MSRLSYHSQMRYYAAPYYPEHLLPIKTKNEREARYRAAVNLSSLISTSVLKGSMPNGFSTRNLIEIKRSDLMPKDAEAIANAVKTLSKLSKAKKKTQELNEQSREAYRSIDCLFEEKLLTDEEYEAIEVNLKTIGEYAKAVSAYKEALPVAQQAKLYLERALEPVEQTTNKHYEK